MTQRRKVDLNPLNSITGILIGIFALVALYWVATSIFWVLTKISPILLIAALIIDHKVVLNYGKWLINLVKRNPVMGIVAILLSVVAYPITFGFLLGKALLKRKVGQFTQEMERRTKGEFVDYEEIEEKKPTILNLPDLKKTRQKEKIKKKNDYEDLFDDLV